MHSGQVHEDVLFVAMLSSTVVSIALPRIIGALNGSQTQYTWVVTATLLTATASTPIWGKLADLYSKKALVQIAIGIFVAGSLISGFAQDAGQLIAARAFQGLGVGGLQALVQTIIAAMIPPKERGRYNGLLGGVMAVATVSGPLLGGVITDTSWLGWRWCFFVGIPFSLVALVVLQRWLHLWLSWQTAALVGPALAVLAIAVWWESRVPEPVLPLSVIRQPAPALAILASLSVGMAMFGGAVFLGQYFQVSRGYSPTEAGLLMIPMMVGTFVSSTVSGQLVSRSGRIKWHIVTGTVILDAEPRARGAEHGGAP